MIRKGNEGKLLPAQATWRNMLFQVPGIGKDKVNSIVGDFCSYEKMSEDCESKKILKNLVVGRGLKGAKIGKSTADRIYKVFGSLNSKEKLY